MQSQLLSQLTQATRAIGLPEAVDCRQQLATNPNGRQWRDRDDAALKGMAWHQELGWGSVEAVARYHTGPQSHLAAGGVESISYTFAIRRNGQIVLCNDLIKSTWSQGYKGRPGDENADFLSVMFEGYFNGPGVTDKRAGEPTDVQLMSGLLLWNQCKQLWGWDTADLYGHYQFGKPACPGNTLQAVIESVRANVPPAPQAAIDLSDSKGRQAALKDLGFYSGVVDGIWGPGSRSALVAFQEAKGLGADGVWGPRTQKAIMAAMTLVVA